MSKRGNGEGSIGRLPNNKWWARITLGYNDAGKPVRKAVYGATRKQVAKELAAMIDARDAGRLTPLKPLTLKQLMERWLQDVVLPNRAPSTYRTHSNYAKNHVYPSPIAGVLARDLTLHELQRFLNAKSAAGMKPNTLKHLKDLISGALTQGVKWEVIDRNVARYTEVPPAPRRLVTPLSVEQAGRLLHATNRSPIYGPIFHLAITTGLREGEILGLTWDRINWATSTATIDRSLQRVDRAWAFCHPKTPASRAVISLTPSTIAALQARREHFAKLPQTPWTELGLVFTTDAGKPIHAADLGRRLRGFLIDAGLPEIRFHDLRHGFASMLIENNAHPRQVMEAMRHSTFSVTMNTYGHIMEGRLREVVQRVDDAIFRGKP